MADEPSANPAHHSDVHDSPSGSTAREMPLPSSQLAFRSRIGGRRRTSIGSSGSSASASPSSPPSSRIVSSRGSHNLRRRQSSLSSQLSSVTTFASDEDSEDETEELDTVSIDETSSGLDLSRRAHPANDPGHRRPEAIPEADGSFSLSLSASLPNRRVSTTPLFPSPLAQALSAHVDDIEPLEMESDVALDADDEAEGTFEAFGADRQGGEFVNRMVQKSPVLRGGSPLRRELASIAPIDTGNLAPYGLSDAQNLSSSVPLLSTSEHHTLPRRRTSLVRASPARLRSVSADPSASTSIEQRRGALSSGNQTSPEDSFDSPKARSKGSGSPTSSRRSSLSVFSGSPASPRMTLGSTNNSPSTNTPAAPPESIKLQRVPSAVRVAQALQPSASSSPSSPSNALYDAPRRASLVASPTPTPATSRASSSRDESTPSAPTPMGGFSSTSLEPESGLRRAHSTMGSMGSAFSPLFSLSPSGAVADGSRRERSVTVGDPADVFGGTQRAPEITELDFTSAFGSVPASRSHKSYGATPLSRGISPLQLAGTGGRAFSVHAPASMHTDSLATPVTRRAQVRRSLAPPTPITAADGGSATDEYARVIMQSRTAKMQKWRADSASDALSPFATKPQRPTAAGESDLANAAAIDDADDGENLHPLRTSQASGGGGEIEWVDWLEEYRQIKAAKIAADLEKGTVDSEFSPCDLPISPHSNMPVPYPFGQSPEDIITPQHQPFDPFAATFAKIDSPSRLQHSPGIERRPPLQPLPEDTVPEDQNAPDSLPSSPTGQRPRKRPIGAFAHIDAWWSAVRRSVNAPDDVRQTGPSGARVARAPAPLLGSSTSRKPPLRTRGSREEMPPPPVPLRASQSGAEIRIPPSAVTNAGHFSGALAPAATIDTQPRRSSTSNTAVVQRPRPIPTTSFPLAAPNRKAEQKRRNPQLSLRLDGTESPANDLPSGSHSSGSGSSRGFSDSAALHRPGQILIERTPGLTPGHAPAWTKTPSILPTSQADARGAPLAPSTIGHGPHDRGNSSFSLQSIKYQIRHQMTFAKESCDKELRKISAGITAHVEQEMRLERMQSAEDTGNTTATLHAKVPGDISPWSSAMASDAETGADSDVPGAEDADPAAQRPRLLTASSADIMATASPPIPLQRRASLAASRGRSQTGDGARSPRRKSDYRKRLSNQMPPKASELAAALGRSVGKSHQSSGVSDTATSSRSTSRSRSPLPGALATVGAHKASDHLSHGTSAPSTPTEPSYMGTLQAITAIATEILDTSVTTLTAEPSHCQELVQRVQIIGRGWDDHPDWPCRGWYVQLLLAVAGLSRVVEWWEAEKGFWKFDDEEGEEQDLIFVAKAGAHEERSGKPRRSNNNSSRNSPTRMLSAPLRSSPAPPSPPSDVAALAAAKRSPEQASIRSTKSTVDLAAAVEQVKSVTILMELSLAEQRFDHLSPVWLDVVGIVPEDCLGQPIAELLLASDAGVFAEATRQLLADDSHTVEVFFRLRVWDEETDVDDSMDLPAKYQAMDAKGMLMRSRESGEPTHTMWVVRPRSGSPQIDGETTLWQDQQQADELTSILATIKLGHLRTEPVLCRMCERAFPAWFFEKHCETCNETHRLERQVSLCNEQLTDLRGTVRHLVSALGQGSTSPALEYSGIAILGGGNQPSTPSPPNTPDLIRRPASPKPHQLVVRRLQTRALDQLLEIIQTTLDISTPALPETFDAQTGMPRRLLTPASEGYLEIVRNWQKPSIEDPALSRLASDVQEQVRAKLGAIDRLHNALLYADQVRAEWQDSVAAAIDDAKDDTAAEDMTLNLTSLTLEENGSNTLALTGLGLGASGLTLSSSDPNLTATASKGPMVVPRTDRSNLAPDSSLTLPEAELALARQRSASVTSPALGYSPLGSSVPLSPQIGSHVPSQRAKPYSIKDFEVIKPISKGAFGSVYLAKKKATGDYYAIKVLKKSDMVAKNQVTNVKAERMILMTQSDSEYVVKLFYTFQSRDYLYLVMEYLNGGDCAALVKALGCLEEEWTRSYIAEVVLGLEYLHQKGVVHRDLKPDNLLIDSKGHLKLTDFGLSKIGLLGRQARGPGLASYASISADASIDSRSGSPASDHQARPSYFFPFSSGGGSGSFGGGSESGTAGALAPRRSPLASPFASAAMVGVSTGQQNAPTRSSTENRKQVVGSPDYIAPESILGLGTEAAVDWWALGVICYEFLYGIPPFHADTPERVFENVLSRHISWSDPPVDISPEARDFMERLLTFEPAKRLGSNGAAEVRAHAFFAEVDWDTLRSGDAAFVPQATDPESTDYFDARGATQLVFEDQDAVPLQMAAGEQKSPESPVSRRGKRKTSQGQSEISSSPGAEDFGAFDYKNLDVLKQANDDVIRKLRSDQMTPLDGALDRSSPSSLPHRASIVGLPVGSAVPGRRESILPTSQSDLSMSQPARGVSGTDVSNRHERRISEHPAPLGRVLSRGSGSHPDMGSSHSRRNSLPTRLRSTSFSSSSAPSYTASATWSRRRGSREDQETPASSVGSPAAVLTSLEPSPTSSGPTIDVLVAEDNPISSKVIEVLLTRLGCRVVVVQDGEEAIRSTMGTLKFDVIFLDIAMPILDGEDTARMIRSTQNVNQLTPIVAVTSYESDQLNEAGTVFSAVMSKPVTRAACSQVLQRLGFSLSNKSGSGSSAQPVPPTSTAAIRPG